MTKALREFDPFLVEAVERALAPYQGKLSPELLEHMREEALVQMSTHPYPVALLGASRPRPAADESYKLAKDGAGYADVDAREQEKRSAAGGTREGRKR